MSHGYVTVQWNKRKVVYDIALWAGIVLYVAVFVGVSFSVFRGDDALSLEIVLMRALATCAFLMLTIILCIGPLARLNERFLPLLYNRRHFGVSMFIIALVHAILAISWYHGFGVVSPLQSILSVSAPIESIVDIPFQPFGLVALLVLFLMAATSHDYWNANLGPTLWKAIHMAVYVAYALLVAHVALGALQESNTGITVVLLFGSVALVGSLHIIAAFHSHSSIRHLGRTQWVDLGRWQDIPENRAIVISVKNTERVAVFRYDETKIAAVSNVCQHQGGPLGEGKIIDGCITCPWHGFQYRPEDGRSPPPFTERIETYRLKLDGDRLLLDPDGLAPGTARPVLDAALSSND